jgi:hypothetical protein
MAVASMWAACRRWRDEVRRPHLVPEYMHTSKYCKWYMGDVHGREGYRRQRCLYRLGWTDLGLGGQ